MHSIEHTIQIYKELAGCYERQQNAGMRDLFLMLAADVCFQAGREPEAEQIRKRLLDGNPQHMLRGYPSFRAAVNAPDVQLYLRQQRQTYPTERAEVLLDGLYRQLNQDSLGPGIGLSSSPIDVTMPPGGPRPGARPAVPVPPPPVSPPPAAQPGYALDATLNPAENYPPGLPPTTHNIDLGEGLEEEDEDTMKPSRPRVFRPDNESPAPEVGGDWGPATLPPGSKSPLAGRGFDLPGSVPGGPAPLPPFAAPPASPRPAPPPPAPQAPRPTPRPSGGVPAVPLPPNPRPSGGVPGLPPVPLPPVPQPPRPSGGIPAIPPVPLPPAPQTPRPSGGVPGVPPPPVWAEPAAPAAPLPAPVPQAHPLYQPLSPAYAAEPEPPRESFGWVSLLLFLVVLAAGGGLLVTTFVLPFLR